MNCKKELTLDYDIIKEEQESPVENAFVKEEPGEEEKDYKTFFKKKTKLTFEEAID